MRRAAAFLLRSAVVLAVACFVCAVIAAWTGDDRWWAEAGVFFLAAFVAVVAGLLAGDMK